MGFRETPFEKGGFPLIDDKPHGGVFRKVFARLFQKAAPSKARSLGRRRNGEISRKEV